LGRLPLLQRSRCDRRRQAKRQMSSSRRKPEDSVDGCRAFAASDRERASTADNGHVRARFERSAQAWTTRATLLDRLEADFDARAVCLARQTRKHRAIRVGQNG
jgi:hypothetical protein